jgi:glutamate formiminotransferase
MLVECVPNFSEGRRPEVLEAIRQAAELPGVAILGLSWDPDHHRAVMTLAGEGEAVLESVWRATVEAVARIDLNHHRGTHPRIGAVDVIPFIPLGDTPMSYCIGLARSLGERIGRDLGIPVLLYEEAASRASRRNLAAVRRGQFEGLGERLSVEGGAPDYGPSAPHPTAGAVAVGARPALIAYNVYLNTADPAVADRVAQAVRGSSGGLRGVKALPMNTTSQGMVQVSMNLTDWQRTSIPAALEMARREAQRYGALVTGTEVVGFVPLGAILDAARYYLQAHDLSAAQVLELALMNEAVTTGVPYGGPPASEREED